MKLARTIHYGYAYARAWTLLRLIYMSRRTRDRLRRAFVYGGAGSISLSVGLGVWAALTVPPTSANASYAARRAIARAPVAPHIEPPRYHAAPALSVAPVPATPPAARPVPPRSRRIVALAEPPKRVSEHFFADAPDSVVFTDSTAIATTVSTDVVEVDAEPPKRERMAAIGAAPDVAAVSAPETVAVLPLPIADITCERSTKGDGPIRVLKTVLTVTNLGATANAVRGHAGAKILGLRSLPLFLIGVVGERIIARHEAANACPPPDVEE